MATTSEHPTVDRLNSELRKARESHTVNKWAGRLLGWGTPVAAFVGALAAVFNERVASGVAATIATLLGTLNTTLAPTKKAADSARSVAALERLQNTIASRLLLISDQHRGGHTEAERTARLKYLGDVQNDLDSVVAEGDPSQPSRA